MVRRTMGASPGLESVVVAARQAVEHAGGALRAAVAGVGAIGREGDGAQRLELPRSRFHHQADLPVPGVIAQRDGRARAVADTAMRAENQDFLAAQRARVPSHAGILAPSEQVAGWAREQHLGRHGKCASGAGRRGAHIVERWVTGIENLVVCHFARSADWNNYSTDRPLFSGAPLGGDRSRCLPAQLKTNAKRQSVRRIPNAAVLSSRQ